VLLKPNWGYMDKVIRDGLVAVVYSPGYGAGWSTWNSKYSDEELMFDSGLVELVLADREHEEIVVYATLKWPDAYLGGLADIEVEWVPVGKRFFINEDDGSEIVVLHDNIEWIIA
jgi:hypothetical protein